MNETTEISKSEILPEENENQQPKLLTDSIVTAQTVTALEKKHKNILTSIIIILLILVILILSVLLCAEKFGWHLSLGGDDALDKWEITEYDNPNVDSDGSGKILLKDSYLGEMWISELEGVDKNCYSDENFIESNGIKEYYVDGKKCSAAGIDVSEFQGNIDWHKVKQAGIDFAMIRIGFRGYGEVGNIVVDEMCRQNLAAADEAGIKLGGYFFSQATSVQEAVDEANTLLEIIKDYDITYPIAFDWEVIGTNEARTDNVSVETLNQCAKAFCETIKQAGYTPAIYMSKRIAYLKYDLEALKDYDIWLTEDGGNASFNYRYDIWQYSYTGSIDGIEGNVDLNISMKAY